MKNKWFLFAVAVFPLFFYGCGLSIYDDWKQSGGKAIPGAGAVAGRDYISGLTPSENSRKYFARISGDNKPVETIHRSDDGESKSGVKFVGKGGILIPPGVTISFENRGYCMDPNLPAPKEGDEYQLVPMARLIPEDLQEIYKSLVTKASAGDESVQANMQHLVWALRTAGTDAAFANNLTPQQKRILDRCSAYPGQFEEYNSNSKANAKKLQELIGKVDSILNVKIGGVSYKASDLLDPDVGNKKINEHLNQLIEMGKQMPVEKSGFNFGEIQPGVYTDIRGTGYMQYRARIANSTNQPFTFYPTDYVGQVGSPTKNDAVATYAAANTTMKQRMTGGNPNDIEVEDEEEPEKKCICAIIAKMKMDIQQKHAYRYETVVKCRWIQWLVYCCPGVGGAVKFFYKSLHGDYESYSDAAKDAGMALVEAYLSKLNKIDFSLISGTDIGSVAKAIDKLVNAGGDIGNYNETLLQLKKDFAKIDKIVQREINGLPKCPVHSK